MIKTFADKRTRNLYKNGKSKRFPPDMWERALRKLERDRMGQHSISINDQWRICFRFKNGDAYDVEITDYH
ncbi:MAG: type II toxin-antitoxin system RelE/ParE family toxin [Nitrospira sp.]|nr:MAG: type II toxin-antitoxin system RelE/ParE family toxin [Nitrospira sp.]